MFGWIDHIDEEEEEDDDDDEDSVQEEDPLSEWFIKLPHLQHTQLIPIILLYIYMITHISANFMNNNWFLLVLLIILK